MGPILAYVKVIFAFRVLLPLWCVWVYLKRHPLGTMAVIGATTWFIVK